MSFLSTSQLASYQRDGFLVIEDFATKDECEVLIRRAGELVESYVPQDSVSIFSTHEERRISDDYFLDSGDKIRFFFEEEAFAPDGRLRQSKELSINKIGHALHDLDPDFNRFSRDKRVVQVVADLGYQNPLLLQSMYIFKQPGIGGEVSCHQDATFLYTQPMDLTGLWFALEDASRENGCLWAIPGGHKLGLKARFYRNGEGGTTFETLDSSPWPDFMLVPLEAKQGTLVILDGLLPHLSYANRSAKSRHAYTLHIIESASEYAGDNWLRRSQEMPLRGF